MMSPGWIRLPSSSQTEMAILPLLSATLHERTSCPSFVLVTRPGKENRARDSTDSAFSSDGTQKRQKPQTRTQTEGGFKRSNAGANQETDSDASSGRSQRCATEKGRKKSVVSALLFGQESSPQLTYFQNYKDDMQVFRSRFYVFNQAHCVVVNIRHRFKIKKKKKSRRRWR